MKREQKERGRTLIFFHGTQQILEGFNEKSKGQGRSGHIDNIIDDNWPGGEDGITPIISIANYVSLAVKLSEINPCEYGEEQTN